MKERNKDAAPEAFNSNMKDKKADTTKYKDGLLEEKTRRLSGALTKLKNANQDNPGYRAIGKSVASAVEGGGLLDVRALSIDQICAFEEFIDAFSQNPFIFKSFTDRLEAAGHNAHVQKAIGYTEIAGTVIAAALLVNFGLVSMTATAEIPLVWAAIVPSIGMGLYQAQRLGSDGMRRIAEADSALEILNTCKGNDLLLALNSGLQTFGRSITPSQWQQIIGALADSCRLQR